MYNQEAYIKALNESKPLILYTALVGVNDRDIHRLANLLR